MKSNTVTYTYVCDLCGKTETFVTDSSGCLLNAANAKIDDIASYMGELNYFTNKRSGVTLTCEHICGLCKNKLENFLIENFPNSDKMEKLKAIREGKLEEYYKI